MQPQRKGSSVCFTYDITINGNVQCKAYPASIFFRFLKITNENLEECDSNIRLMDLKNDLVFKIRSFLIEVGIPYFAVSSKIF